MVVAVVTTVVMGAWIITIFDWIGAEAAALCFAAGDALPVSHTIFCVAFATGRFANASTP